MSTSIDYYRFKGLCQSTSLTNLSLQYLSKPLSTRAKPEVMEKANKKVSILLTPCSSQNNSAKQQHGSYQMFMWPKNLQQAEVARYVVESANRCIVQLAKAMGWQTAGKRRQDLEGYVN